MFSSVSGGAAVNIVEVNLGTLPALSGSFDITSSGLDTNNKVLISLAVGPYTAKGTLVDEMEMEPIVVTGYVVDTTTIRCYWNSGQTFVSGNFKFSYSLL